MTRGTSVAADGMHVVDRCLIVSVNREPGDDELRALRRKILAQLKAEPVKGTLIDVSQVRVLDSVLYGVLIETAQMIRLLGCKTIFVGFQAGVASALVDLDVDIDSIQTALTMEDGLELLKNPEQARDEIDDDEQTGPDRSDNDELGEADRGSVG